MTKPDIRALPLETAGVALEPLAEAHRVALAVAGAAPEIWHYLPYDSSAGGFDRWFEASLKLNEDNREAIGAVRTLADGAVV